MTDKELRELIKEARTTNFTEVDPVGEHAGFYLDDIVVICKKYALSVLPEEAENNALYGSPEAAEISGFNEAIKLAKENIS